MVLLVRPGALTLPVYRRLKTRFHSLASFVFLLSLCAGPKTATA